MKKLFPAFLSIALCLTACGNSLGSDPVTVSGPFSSSQSQPDPLQQLEQEADREGASRTDNGVYYRPDRFFEQTDTDRLPTNALSMEQAAQKASEYAAAMGLPVSNAVWELRVWESCESLDSFQWECNASLPPYTSHRIEYQAEFEYMMERPYNWSVSITMDAVTGSLTRYYCSPVDPFDLEEHTAEELTEHERQRQEWQGSEEFRQILLDGADALGVGPVKRLVPPDDKCQGWRLELENGDTYFAEAFYGKKELYELQYSLYYVNGDQIAPPAAGS